VKDPLSLKAKARSLRNHPTPSERLLWKKLRKRQLAGLKFQRQYAIEAFIVDFVCLEKKLIVELDGLYHNHQQNEDQRRDALLRGRGFAVVRFENDDVANRLEGVLAEIECRAFA
jgi:very-short-patch-repair endonuclease